MEKTYASSMLRGTCTTMIESDRGAVVSFRGSMPTSRMFSGPLMSLRLVAPAAASPNRFLVCTAPAYRATSTWLVIRTPPLTTMSTQPTIAQMRAHSGADRPVFRLPPVGASPFVGFPLLVTRSSVLPVGVPAICT